MRLPCAKLVAFLRKEFYTFHSEMYAIKTLGDLLTFCDQTPLDHLATRQGSTRCNSEIIKKALHQVSNKVGIDIEMISKFPIVDDYWVNQFYQDNFSPREIAYCIKEINPPEHFAGRWCVKEAIFKCLGALQGIPFSAIEIAMIEEDNLTVFFLGENDTKIKLPFQVSISHAGDYATAVAIHCE